MTRARDIMTREVICIPGSLSAARAWSIMHEARIRHLPVVEDARLLGIVSDRDLLRVVGAHGRSERETAALTPVANLMTRSPMTCAPSWRISQLAGLMVRYKLDALPIMQRDELVGIVTSHDLLELLADEDDSLANLLPFDFKLLRYGSAQPVGS